MPTSVHLPKPLLAAVDRRARALKMSRNRLIVQLLERELGANSKWSPEFFATLSTSGPEVSAGVREMTKAIEKHRTSKKPVRL